MNEDLLVLPDSYKGSGGFGGRQAVARRWFGLLVRDAKLKPGDSVLDVGCGLGRIAVPLMGYLTGRYEGFDIDAKAIKWCQDNITPKAPHFRFQAVAVHNNMYNPSARTAPETFRFPYEDDAFDVAFLASVFTHMLTKSVARYMAELRRVLKPGGRLVASYFLLNEASEKAIATGAAMPNRSFPFPMEAARVQNRDVPEAAVAHQEADIRKLYQETGLDITDVSYGRWTGNRTGRGGQDVVFAVKQ